MKTLMLLQVEESPYNLCSSLSIWVNQMKNWYFGIQSTVSKVKTLKMSKLDLTPFKDTFMRNVYRKIHRYSFYEDQY